jgi:asparagine synthase (glutamine-hydrolysing)
MCGISGYLSIERFRSPDEMPALLRAMGRAIVTRGPDDSGEWFDSDAGIGLAHRRLSVLDLSPAGHQPMRSVCQRFVLVFNGEVYNHLDLRRSLEAQGQAPVWRGHSDTETLLAGFTAWGVEHTVRQAIGMFAFALWDRSQRCLILGRDRIGEKPLFYGWQDGAFLFGSELKALRAHPAFQGGIDRGALCLYMRHNCVPAPHSIHPGIRKLPPACLLTVSLQRREPEIRAYWSGLETALHVRAHPFQGSPSDAVQSLDALLRDAIGAQMVADVPLGAFLSGGVDSSTIVALMQVQSTRPVKTFSIGFDEGGFDEAMHAKAVARHLGTDHEELYVTDVQARLVIPRLPELYDEPFADSSQIPTFLVAQLARRHVTVSLSGDAGDELFCGYNRYLLAQRLWRNASVWPDALRGALARALTGFSPHTWNQLAAPLLRCLPARHRHTNVGDKLHKLAGVLGIDSADALYRRLVSHWDDPAAVVVGGAEPATLLQTAAPALDALGDIERMMALDLVTYLPDDNLVKVDRAAMGNSLESRVPLLDHRVVEFAWSLPMDFKLRNGVTKWVLRQVLYRYVPKELIERPKMGFGVPIETWLRGPLRDWAESLIAAPRLRSEGYFDAALVRERWDEHLSGRRNWHYHLWDVLMFQAWLEHQQAAVAVDRPLAVA